MTDETPEAEADTGPPPLQAVAETMVESFGYELIAIVAITSVGDLATMPTPQGDAVGVLLHVQHAFARAPDAPPARGELAKHMHKFAEYLASGAAEPVYRVDLTPKPEGKA